MTATDLLASVRRSERLLHQHAELGELAILRLLQLLQLVLQLGHVALQFLDFLAGAGRWQRASIATQRRRKHSTRENASEHMQVSSPGANRLPLLSYCAAARATRPLGLSTTRRASVAVTAPARSGRGDSSASRIHWLRCTADAPCRS